MPFTLERHAMKVPGSIYPSSVYPPKISHSISEFIHASESQRAVVLETRSMPCLSLPVSRSNSAKYISSKTDSCHIERPGSPSSTGSSRRSVSSMKQLLPLQLQPAPPVPRVDLSAWLADSVPDLQSSTTFDLNIDMREYSSKFNGVPWMASLQGVQLSHDIPPDQYREMPIYSEPGSPLLSRAYFNDLDPCRGCLAPGLSCNELCILSDYEDANSADSYSEDSFVDCHEGFGTFGNESAEMSPTLFTSSQVSELSIKCQGDDVHSFGSRSSSVRLNECDGVRTSNRFADSGIALGQNNLEAWIGSDSSQCSSPVTDDGVFNAFVTKLSPAKAHVVQLPKSAPLSPLSVSRAKSSWQPRPATPYKTRRYKASNNLRTTSNSNSDNKYTHLPGIEEWPLQSSQLHTSQNISRIPRPPISHSRKHLFFSPQIPGTFSQQPLDQRSFNPEKKLPEDTSTIIGAIRKAVDRFPQDLLSLNSPCILDIHRLYQNAAPAAVSSNRSSSSPTVLDNLPTTGRPWRLSLHKPSKPKNLLRRAASTKEPPCRQYPVRLSPTRRLASRDYPAAVTSAAEPHAPDLSSLQKIFPLAERRWLEILYAYLMVFNYIGDFQELSKSPTVNRSLKASLTLGVPPYPFRRSISAAQANHQIQGLRSDVLRCTAQLTKFMSGTCDDVREVEDAYSRGQQGDEALARALAEILRINERCAG